MIQNQLRNLTQNRERITLKSKGEVFETSTICRGEEITVRAHSLAECLVTLDTQLGIIRKIEEETGVSSSEG